MDAVLTTLRAASEPLRLRLLALCAEGELAVGELVEILGRSQPLISRHLKVLTDAGLLERLREGAWVFYRLAGQGNKAAAARQILALLPEGDPTLKSDRVRLSALKEARAARAAAYFRDNAAQWASLRALHVAEAEVEAALLAMLPSRPIADALDIGTGTGRILELLAPRAERAIGIDASREMLALARARIEEAGLRQAGVRQADMYRLPFDGQSFDLVVIHQVLHFADRPAAAVAEAARVLKPEGLLLVVDFAPHDLEYLRSAHNHRRLGFSDEEVGGWLNAAGVLPLAERALPGQPLTVKLWLARAPAGGRNFPETHKAQDPKGELS